LKKNWSKWFYHHGDPRMSHSMCVSAHQLLDNFSMVPMEVHRSDSNFRMEALDGAIERHRQRQEQEEGNASDINDNQNELDDAAFNDVFNDSGCDALDDEEINSAED
jgi:hypothetical protein